MKNIKTIAGRSLAAVLIVGFVYLGLKSLVVNTWKTSGAAETFAVYGDDGRTFKLILLPNNYAYFVYSVEKPVFFEIELAKLRGSYGTNYFGRIWKMEGPGVGSGLFGLRVYPKNTKPVVMETTVVNKFVYGSGIPTLGEIGDRTHPIFVFSESSITFEGVELTREPTSLEFISLLESKVGSPKEQKN